MSNVFLHLDIEFVMSNAFLHLDIARICHVKCISAFGYTYSHAKCVVIYLDIAKLLPIISRRMQIHLPPKSPTFWH